MAAKKCSKCGEEKPLDQFYKFKHGKLGRQAECKPCSGARRRAFAATRPELERESRREWARNNPPTAEQKARKAAYRDARKGAISEYSKRWYLLNRERLKSIRQAWHQANRAARNAKSLAYYKADVERWQQRHREWAKANPEKMRGYAAVSDAKRRAAKRGSPGHWTEADVQVIFSSQRGRCVACRCKLDRSFHRDHIVALACGGSNEKSNLQLLCKSCNSRKHKKDPIRFMQEQGFLL